MVVIEPSRCRTIRAGPWRRAPGNWWCRRRWRRLVLRFVVRLIVHAEHDGDVFALGRRGDDDLLDRAAHVLGGVLGFGEATGGFDDDVAPTLGQSISAGSLVAETLISCRRR